MFSKIISFGLLGLDAYKIDVETDISQGMPSFDIVGLPDASVRESRDRVRSALKNCKFDFPVSKIIINLAPADVKKAGPVYDLPIFLGILSATRQINGDFSQYAFIGELSLTGEIRPVNGILPMVIAAKAAGCRAVFVPAANALEGSIVQGIAVYGAENVMQVIGHLAAGELLQQAIYQPNQADCMIPVLDFCDVKGQYEAKRALEIAAAGGHNLLLIGPPGSGKSMLAKRLPSILPEMGFEESLETTKLYSIAGLLPRQQPLITQRPFRSPHHTVSPAGLSGGGTIPKPGEISLAHNGVLFLDELPEFSRSALEILRQPIEDGKVTISRVSASLSYPCSIMLVCAMNPCPCGYFGHPSRKCSCSTAGVQKYLSRVSGPLLDRLDLHVEVMPAEFDELSSAQKGESSALIRQRVDAARKIQAARYKDTSITCNARITPALLEQSCPLTERARVMLQNAFDRLGLSARAYDRLLKVARTIADLGGEEQIHSQHIAEAIQYRSLDRKYWNS